MRVLNVLHDLRMFLSHNRGSGTSTILKRIASEKDVYVLVSNERMRREFGDCAVTLDGLYNKYGLDRKPILFDNHVLIVLVEEILDELNKLENKLKKWREFIATLKCTIEQFESQFTED